MKAEISGQEDQAHGAFKGYWLVGCTMALLHGLLFLHDLAGDAGFRRADRAQQRFATMKALMESVGSYDTFIATLVRQGNIGDYGVHTLLYSMGGYLAVTAFESLLAVLSIVCVVYIALRVFRSEKFAVVAAFAYALLPQSLAFPHQLLSESLSNPLAIFGTAAFLKAFEAPSKWWPWIVSGLFLGLAGMTRPALILLPLVAATLLLMFDRRIVTVRQAGSVVVAGLVPFVAWGLFMQAHTGKFGFGESNQDLGLNLSQSTAKVLLMVGLAPADGTPPAWLPERLTLPQYFDFVRAHPKGYANLYLKNVFVLVSDSGIGRLYVDLLGFGAEARMKLQDPGTGWRAQLTNNGLIAMLKYGMTVAPGTIIAGVLGALGFAILNVGLLVAYVVMLKRGSVLWNPTASLEQRWGSAFLLIVPLYVIVTSQVVAYAPSRLRSQGEFAWAILACFGWAVVYAWIRARRRTAPQAEQQHAV